MSYLQIVGTRICTVCLCAEFSKHNVQCLKCGNMEFWEIDKASGEQNGVSFTGKKVRYTRVEL